MRPQVAGSTQSPPEIGNESLAQLGVRADDIRKKTDSDDISPLEMLGMSVTIGDPTKTPYSGNSKYLYKIKAQDLAKFGLMFVPKNDPKVPTAGLIIPIGTVKVATFRAQLAGTAGSWSTN